jgi:phage-related protein
VALNAGAVEQEIAIIITAEVEGAQAQINKLQVSLDKLGGRLTKVENKLKKQNEKNKQAANSSRKLTSAMLGLMFTSMALNRVFMSLITPVLEVMGVFDMWNAMVISVMLPVMGPLVDILYGLMDFFMNLPEGMQFAIGLFVVLGAIITGLVVIVAMAIIGIGAIAGALGIGFAAAAALIGWIIAAVAVIVVGLGAIIWGIMDLISGKFEGIGKIIMGIGLLLFLFMGGWIPALVVAIGAAVWAIIKYWDEIWAFLKGIGIWIGDTFTKVWAKVGEAFTKIWDGVKETFKGVINFFIQGINAVIGALNGVKFTVPNWIPGVGGKSFGVNIAKIPTFATGGVMPYTGLAMLHKGETVIPANQTTNNAPITINATIANDYDVSRLADQLSKRWVNDMERVSKGRGMI